MSKEKENELLTNESNEQVENKGVENETEKVEETPTNETPEETVADNNESAADELMKNLEAAKAAREAALASDDITSTTQPKEETPATETVSKTEVSSNDDEDIDDDDSDSSVNENDFRQDDDEQPESFTLTDFSNFSLEELAKHGSSLLDLSNIEHAHSDFQAAREAVSALFEAEKQQAKAQYVEAQGNSEGFQYPQNPHVEKFFESYNAFKAKRTKFYDDLNKEKEKNLAEKNKIVDIIRNIVESEDISKMVGKENSEKVKSLQEKWRQIGSVPKADADELYKSYRALIDRFYANKRMAYEFQQLDRKKNLKIKEGICEKAEALLEEENVNDAVKKLNRLHEDYKATGAVPREVQEELWQRFKTASDKIYEKKRAFAEEYKKELQENMELKQALCLRAEEFLSFNSNSIKEWNEATQQLLSLQEEWEKIGPLPREVAKNINKQFWGNFKQFFANKNKFFSKLDEQRQDNLKKKEELCEKAEAIQESVEWEETANELKKLQKKWREIGPVPEAHRDSIYARFKAACDKFFDRRRNRKAEQEKVFEDNYTKKAEICDKIEALAKEGVDMEKLNSLKEEFLATGFVPRDKISTIMDRFTEVIDTYFKATDLDEDEREKQSLEMLVEVYKSGPNASKRLDRKRQAIRNKINNLENDINLWMNNIEFFSKSKNAESLREEFGEKIHDAKVKLEKLKRQFRVIKNI